MNKMRSLLLAGLLLALGVGVNGATVNDSSVSTTATDNVLIEIVKPLSVTIEDNDLDFGTYVSGVSLENETATSEVTIDGTSGNIVTLTATGTATLSGPAQIAVSYGIDNTYTIGNATKPVLTVTIDDTRTDLPEGIYKGTVNVTAVYQ